MKFFLHVLAVLSFFFLRAHAGTPGITGTIVDHGGQPAGLVNVILLQSPDSSMVKSALSDPDGKFSFEEIPSGSYRLLISQLGGKYYTESFTIANNAQGVDMGTVKLPGNTVALPEVQVKSFRPFVEHRLDETVVNVENSIVNAGGTVLEVLKRSPGVTVDNDGTIRLAGKQGVQVMIDGKTTYLSEKDMYEMLRNTPSDQLSQVVINTNPSARYDAAGNSGIINLKMKKKQNLGWNGNFRVSYGQGRYPDFGTGLQLNYRNEKFNAFGGYDFMRAFYFEEISNVRRFNESRL